MKKIIVLSLILCGFYPAYSQDLIKEIQKLTLANDSLQKQVIKPLRDSILRLNTANSSDVSKLQRQINTLEKDKVDLTKKIKDFEKDIADLNKNEVKIERDSLQKQVDSLTAKIAELNQKIQEKERQIGEEKRIGEQNAKAEKEKGKNETLTDVVNNYKSKKFDDLIVSSTKLSVQRDIKLVGFNAEVKPILSDLEMYFNAEELLAQKFDADQIKNKQTQLNQIKQQSAFLNKLKENLEFYKDYNGDLKKTIDKLVDLDKRKIADKDIVIQKLKFNEIVSELADYMYNYYAYSNYPFLSDIVLEIIKRKKPNADADISDLLRKL